MEGKNYQRKEGNSKHHYFEAHREQLKLGGINYGISLFTDRDGIHIACSVAGVTKTTDIVSDGTIEIMKLGPVRLDAEISGFPKVKADSHCLYIKILVPNLVWISGRLVNQYHQMTIRKCFFFLDEEEVFIGFNGLTDEQQYQQLANLSRLNENELGCNCAHLI